MMIHSLVVILLACRVLSVTGACRPADQQCVFHLDVTQELTMVYQDSIVKLNSGKVYKIDATSFNNNTEIPLDKVITGDGFTDTRKVTVFNEQMPGPPIEVYEGQTVIVHVTNSMDSETTSVHWYGVDQRGSPWMDGVGYITQCPILPGESFTYRFKANRAGTYWYKSHMPGQAMDGAFGPFIVRKRRSQNRREFIMTVQDWNHSWDNEEMKLKREHGWYLGGKQLPASTSPSGSKYSMLRVDSGLINGRGIDYTRSESVRDAPLSRFDVQQGFDYRFRTIHAGNMLPFRISIDNHTLTIVALDGVDIVPFTVESFVISPGERVDFIIYGDNPVNNYWIRGEALEARNPHRLDAVLHYVGASEAKPTSRRKSCSADDICLILNCPFADYVTKPNTKCIPLDALKSLKPDPVSHGSSNFRELFLNFAFPGYDDKPGSVNGHAFNGYPHGPPLTQTSNILPCDHSVCDNDKVCHCPLVLNLQHGTDLQLVLINMGQGRGWDHSVHIHGHHFAVLKTGFPTYNTTTGLYRGDNLDVDCLGNPNRELNFCNTATWGNPTWLNGNIPGVHLRNPPQKDTVVVPSGGYVVIRLTADNPGLWMVHCENSAHEMEGMVMFLNESVPSIPSPPAGFPACGDFNLGSVKPTSSSGQIVG